MLQMPAGPTLFRFSTAEIAVCERYNAVFQLRERGILPIEPLPDALVAMQITKFGLPGMGIFSGKLKGLRQEGRPHSADINDDVFLGVNLAGRSIAYQGEREIPLGEGDAVLLSCAGDGFAITRPTPVQFLGVRVPRKAVAPLVNGLDDRVGRLIPTGTGAVKLLVAYLDAVAKSQILSSPNLTHAVVSHVQDLVALSVEADKQAGVRADSSVRAARLQAIKAEIVARLGDALLSVAEVAAHQGVTPPLRAQAV